MSQIEVYDPRGGATPLHVHHNEDETFYVLDGEVSFVVGDERIYVAAATSSSLRATSLTLTSFARSAHACS